MDATDKGPTEQGQQAKAVLMPYFLAMVGLTVVTHLVIAARGPKIDVIDGLVFFVTSFVPYLIFVLSRGHRLKFRFGPLVAHAGTYAIVNTGWQLHAYIQTAMASEAKWASATAAGSLPLDESWFGPTMGMAGFWGIGLVLHFLGSTVSGGYEESLRGRRPVTSPGNA